MKTKLQKNFFRLFLLLFVALLLIWGAFYALAMHILTQTNEQLILSTADELLEDLSENIELMEQINYSVSQKEELQAFLAEGNLALRHEKATLIHEILQDELLPIDNRFSIVVFDNIGWFYRFSGSISVTECERLFVLADSGGIDKHFPATLAGTNHIGYANPILDEEGETLGTLIVLESEQNFLEYYYDSAEDFVVSAAILSGEAVISANAPYIGEASPLFTKRQVGITPFQVATWLSPDYDNAIGRYFAIGVVLSTFLMVTVLLLFVHRQRKSFLAPLVHLMGEADRLGPGGENRLSPIENEDFDKLISKINALLTRIDKQNETVQATLLDAEHSKTQAQEAVNILLKKQINAHFVINTLSAIQMLQKRGDTEKSDAALAALSDMVRYAFEEIDSISVWDELSHLQKYVEIMNIRYNDKIIFDLEADDSLMEVPIPRMLLQPLVENSIVHGFVGREENCRITVLAKPCEQGVVLVVSDNGCGVEESLLQKMNTPPGQSEKISGVQGLDNMAVYNVKRRLAAHNATSTFHVLTCPGKGTCTTITVKRSCV